MSAPRAQGRGAGAQDGGPRTRASPAGWTGGWPDKPHGLPPS